MTYFFHPLGELPGSGAGGQKTGGTSTCLRLMLQFRCLKLQLDLGRTTVSTPPVCRRAASLQISGGIYPSWNFAPTRLNVADCPTRDKPFPGLCKSLSNGLSLDLVRTFQIPQLSRPGANWIRLCILITLSNVAEAADLSTSGFLPGLCLWTDTLRPVVAWISCNLLPLLAQSLFGLLLALLISRQPSSVPTLRVCCPGKLGPCWFVLISVAVLASHGMPLGPETAAERGRAEVRSSANLQATRVVRKQTLDSRDKLLHEFGRWLWDERRVRLTTLLEKKPPDPEEICAFLVAYGQEMFAAGRSYGRYAETINSIAAARPLIKKQLTAAWDLAFCWLSDEPHQHHPAMPRSVLLASTTLALMWGWPYVASVLCIGWTGIMRIGEVILARRSDLEVCTAYWLRFVVRRREADLRNINRLGLIQLTSSSLSRPCTRTLMATNLCGLFPRLRLGRDSQP